MLSRRREAKAGAGAWDVFSYERMVRRPTWLCVKLFLKAIPQSYFSRLAAYDLLDLLLQVGE
jgi:hypothetical protein